MAGARGVNNETALRERGALLDELGQIVQSMRNLAMAELQRVAKIRPAQMEARQTVADALAALQPDGALALSPVPASGPVSWLVIGAERGFCGAFNAQLLEAVQDLCAGQPEAHVLLASARLARLAEGGVPEAMRTTMKGCAALDEAEPAVDEWLAAIWGAGHAGRAVWLMHVGEHGIVREPLWPPVPWSEASRPDQHGSQACAFLTYVPQAQLHAALARQACRLTVQSALQASLEQENRWRLSQMQRAHDHLDDLRRQLRQRYAALRQANITNELETLASSTLVGMPGQGARGAAA
jgi:F-type H+-transporting ATPase subunit gamma